VRRRASFSFAISHLLVASALWASGYVFVKTLNPVLAPFSLSAVRASVAAAAIGVFMGFVGERPWPRAEEWRPWIALGAIQGWIPNVLTGLGLRTTSAGVGSMIQASAPLVVALIAHLAFQDERLTRRRGLGLVLGFAGVAGLIVPTLVGGDRADAAGALYMVGVTLSYALAGLYVRMIGGGHPLRLAFGQQTFSALPSIVLALLFDPAPKGMTPWPLVAWSLGIGIVATAAPMAVYMRLLSAAGPTRAALVYYLLPLWATLLGWLLLGESLALRQAVSGAVLLTGVWIAGDRRKEETALEKPQAAMIGTTDEPSSTRSS
jgi:drug/metabolite transporter (DMT)-like permease